MHKRYPFTCNSRKKIELIQYSICAVSAFNFCFPLDAFEYLNLSDTCRHISHPHIHKCMFRLHDDMKFRPCIPRILEHTLIRMSSSHRLKKILKGKNGLFKKKLFSVIFCFVFVLSFFSFFFWKWLYKYNCHVWYYNISHRMKCIFFFIF